MADGRENQRARTRQAIIDAARELMDEGSPPTIAEVAARALVSPATAYRYFPSTQALWRAIARAHPAGAEPDVLLDDTTDVDERVAQMVRAVGWAQYDDEHLWRTALRAFLSSDDGDGDLLRSGERLRWIDAALGPVASQLTPEVAQRLRSGLALVFGVESLVTLRDVCGLSPGDAKSVSLWAARALVRAALDEQDDRARGTPD